MTIQVGLNYGQVKNAGENPREFLEVQNLGGNSDEKFKRTVWNAHHGAWH